MKVFQKINFAKSILVVFALLQCSNKPYPYPEDLKIWHGALTEDPKTLDPAEVSDTVSHSIAGQIYSSPLQYKYLKRPIELEAASSTGLGIWGIHSGIGVAGKKRKDLKGKPTYTLHFKKQNYFQSDICFDPLHKRKTTREIRAKDYAYSIKRQSDPTINAAGSFLINGIIFGMKEYSLALHKEFLDEKIPDLSRELKGLEILGPYSIRITLSGKSKMIRYFFASIFSAPVPEECVAFYDGSSEKRPMFRQHPVGNGAYRLEKWHEGHSLLLTKNENYREEFYPSVASVQDRKKGFLNDKGKKLPLIEKALFRIVKQDIPRWLLFTQGYLEGSGISRDVFSQVVNGNKLTPEFKAKGIHLSVSTPLLTYYFIINMKDKVLGGFSKRAKLLRKALSLAVDRKAYIENHLNGRGLIAQGPIPPGMVGYDANYKNPWVKFNIKKAKRLLVQAGYASGINPKTKRPLVIHYMTTSGSGSRDYVRFLEKNFSKLGIVFKAESYTWAIVLKKMRTGEFQMSQSGWQADYPEAENFMQLFYSKNIKNSGTNSSRYNSPKFDKLYKKLYNATKTKQKELIVKQMQIVLNEDMPWIYTIHRTSYSLIHKWYKNHKEHPLPQGLLRYKNIDVEQRKAYRQSENKPQYWTIVLFVFILSLIGFRAVMEKRNLK